MRRVRMLLALLALPLVTCRAPVESPASSPPAKVLARIVAENVVVFGATPVLRFTPPPIYTMWRIQVEQCSGLRREGWPTFFVAPTIRLELDAKSFAIGLYRRDGQRIIFALGYEAVDWVVRHELLHWLLDVGPGEESHPEEYFDTRCGRLVAPLEVRP